MNKKCNFKKMVAVLATGVMLSMTCLSASAACAGQVDFFNTKDDGSKTARQTEGGNIIAE